MNMESTLEPELDLSLKIQLAQNILNPNRGNLKEAAFVMDDMLTALAGGDPEVPAFVAYHNLNLNKPIRAQNGPSNRALAARQDEANYMALQDQEREVKFAERDNYLKKRMEFYKKQKQVKELMKHNADREVKEREDRERAKREDAKRKHYAKIKDEFMQERLPLLEQ
jgi:hypothetical protein